MGLFLALFGTILALIFLLAWASDRRDRRSGHTGVRSDRELTAAGRAARRSARWRRAQLDREIMPPSELDDRDR